MKPRAGIFWLSAVLLLVIAIPAQAQTNGSAATAEKTIWDGVYTDAQANRGQQAVQQNCGSCHSVSEWTHSFIAGWSGRSIGDLQDHLRMTMPMDGPGRLSAEQYTDIVAYMLKLNNVPAGEKELPADEATLKKITVTRGQSR